MVLGQYGVVLVDIGTGSVEGSSGWYLVVMGQEKAVLVNTLWYSVSIGWYWFILYGNGSVWSGTGSHMMALGQYGSILVGTW